MQTCIQYTHTYSILKLKNVIRKFKILLQTHALEDLINYILNEYRQIVKSELNLQMHLKLRVPINL